MATRLLQPLFMQKYLLYASHIIEVNVTPKYVDMVEIAIKKMRTNTRMYRAT